jgi:hypothetical protein
MWHSLYDEQHAHQSIQMMCKSLKRTMLNTLDFNFTDDLPDTHIFAKCKQFGIYLTKMYWLRGHMSKLSVSNKILIYKAILKPIWTYGIQIWGTTSNSNITILEPFQSKVLCLIVNAPRYVPNSVIRKDLWIPSVKEENSHFSSHYAVLHAHPNELISTFTKPPLHKSLCRYWPNDLLTRL